MAEQSLADIRKQIIRELGDVGAYLYYGAKSGSQYVKFGDPRLGSLRIADHEGIEKYPYRWNVLVGGRRRTRHLDKRVQEFYPLEDIALMCNHIRDRQIEILDNFGNYNPDTDPHLETRSRATRRKGR